MDLFKLLGTIAIENSEANKALDETGKKAKKAGKDVESSADDAEKAGGRWTAALGKIGKGAAVVGKGILVGLGAAATGMGALTVKALNLSGDLEQNMGGAEAVFGELGKTIGDMSTTIITGYDKATGKAITATTDLETVSKDAYKNMGLSQSDYLATANKMGALFKGAGFETQEALNLSSQAMQRAADVASIMGIDTEAAMEAVAGAAKGNFTMMDNLGVAMNDTAIAAYAQSKGINKSTQEMTQQEKIGLAMEMFLDKTSYAAGNYAKENETLAGSLSTAKSALTNFLSGSGDVDSLVSSFSNLANVVVKSLTEIAPRLTTGLSDAVQQIVPLIPPLLNTLLPVLVDGAVTLVDGLVQAMPGIISAIMSALPALIEGIIQLVMGILAALPQILGSLISAVPAALSGIWDGIANVFSGLGKWFGDKFKGAKDAAVNAWSDAKEKWNGIKEKCAEGFSNLKEKFGTKFKEAKDNALQKWSDAKTKFSSVKDKVVGAFSNLKDKISPLFSKAKENATQTWSTVKSSFEKIKNGDIVGAFNDLGSMLKGKFKNGLNLAKKGFDGIKTIGKNLVQGLWNGINNAKDWVLGKIKGFGKGILNGLKSFFGIKSPSRVMRDQVGKMIAEGVAVGMEGEKKRLESAAEKNGKIILDTAKKVLEDHKTYNDLTLDEEMKFWDEIRVQCKEGTDARIEADKKYLDAKKAVDEEVKKANESVIDANDELLKAENELQSALDDINESIKDRQSSILDTFSLFEKYTGGNAKPIANSQLLGNLESQIKSLDMWSEELGKLESRIGGSDLFKEISGMGVEALSQVMEINTMTDESLQEYVELYNKRTELAGNLASHELEDETNAKTQEAFQKFADKCTEISDKVGETFAGMKDVSNTAFAEIGTAVENSANTIETALDKMKTAFESWKPDLKTPHFSISGGFDVGSGGVPSVDVEWYKKAMDNAVVLDEPTIFGYNQTTGKLMGAGEAGSEVVAGSNTLMSMIQSAVAEQNSTLTYYLHKIIEMLASYFPQLKEAFNVSFAVDGYELATAMAVPMNQALGKLSNRKDRGR